MAALAVPVFPEKARFGYINAERIGEVLNTEIIGSDGALGWCGGWRSLGEEWGGQE